MLQEVPEVIIRHETIVAPTEERWLRHRETILRELQDQTVVLLTKVLRHNVRTVRKEAQRTTDSEVQEVETNS